MNYQPTVRDYQDKNQLARLQDERDLRFRVKQLEEQVGILSETLSDLKDNVFKQAAMGDIMLSKQIEELKTEFDDHVHSLANETSENFKEPEGIEGETFILVVGDELF